MSRTELSIALTTAEARMASCTDHAVVVQLMNKVARLRSQLRAA